MDLGDGVEAGANRLEVANLLFVEKRELSFTASEEVLELQREFCE